MTTLDSRLAKLASNSHTLSVEYNEHKNYYETLEEHLEGQINNEELLQFILDADTLWTIQLYPETPIGFYRVYAPTLQGAIARMEELVSGNAR